LMEPVGNSPAEFRTVIDHEIVRWAPVIKALELKINGASMPAPAR